jgi:hypothetical protein
MARGSLDSNTASPSTTRSDQGQEVETVVELEQGTNTCPRHTTLRGDRDGWSIVITKGPNHFQTYIGTVEEKETRHAYAVYCRHPRLCEFPKAFPHARVMEATTQYDIFLIWWNANFLWGIV